MKLDIMERISKNFTYEEFEKSATADAHGIVNRIPVHLKPAVRALTVNLLQPVCDKMGWHNIISSGYRCDELNRIVGGVATSQHRKGEAADNKFYEVVNGKKVMISPIEVARTVIDMGLAFDQMILYPTFVHLSYCGANRKQVLYNKRYTGSRL
jgi:hypothetical protein